MGRTRSPLEPASFTLALTAAVDTVDADVTQAPGGEVHAAGEIKLVTTKSLSAASAANNPVGTIAIVARTWLTKREEEMKLRLEGIEVQRETLKLKRKLNPLLNNKPAVEPTEDEERTSE